MELRSISAGLVLAAAVAAAAQQPPPDAPARERELAAMRQEIARLQAELGDLQGRERGVLVELERVGARLRLRQAELDEVTLQLELTGSAAARAATRLEALRRTHADTRRYLEFRLREIYKRGPGSELRRLVGGGAVEGYLRALNYASWLSERDARALVAYRDETRALRREAELLARETARLESLRDEAAARRDRLVAARREHGAMLTRIRRDRDTRRAALGELESAAARLDELAQGGEAASPGLEVRKFRGLLDPPAEGEISARFGRVVHPRFRTEVPHPGIDIDAPAGADFRAVFGGNVLFASWLRGYGLTVIVDHGDELLSIYAHASVLLVGKGDRVAQGQPLGKVGDTGSLRGPYLYFELRDRGKPVDPATWLRSR